MKLFYPQIVGSVHGARRTSCAPNCSPTRAETDGKGLTGWGVETRGLSVEWLFSRINTARDLLTDCVRFPAPPPNLPQPLGLVRMEQDHRDVLYAIGVTPTVR